MANGLGKARLQQKDDIIALEEESTFVYQAGKRLKVAGKKIGVVAKKVGKFLGETGAALGDSILPKYFKDRRNLKEFNELEDKKKSTADRLQV